MSRVGLAVSFLVVTACASGGAQSPTPTAERPTDEAIAPILQEKCFRCHANGGAAADEHDFAKVTTLHAQRHRIHAQVDARTMPPPGASALTDAQRDVLLRWAEDH